ncbi:SMP-30/gluconolactonase/LRE family protein [soil metagenome]
MTAWKIIARDRTDMIGEGTYWSARENAVYWVDALGPAVNRLSLIDGQVARWAMPEPLGWIIERERGGFIVGTRDGLARLDLDPFALEARTHPDPGLPHHRMNDAKADAEGRIWFNTMDSSGEGDDGSLYRLDADGRWTRIDTGYCVPNGPALSPCGRWLYHADTARSLIYRYARTDDGGVTDRQVFVRFSQADGVPDGMTTDAQGHLWVAHWGGGRISRFAPDATLDRAIPLPARQITNIVFAGEHLDRMFVTSAAHELSAPSDYDGALFEVDSGTRGAPTHRYAG